MQMCFQNGSRKHNNPKVLGLNITFGRGEAEITPEDDTSKMYSTEPGGSLPRPEAGYILKKVLFSLCKGTIRKQKLSDMTKVSLVRQASMILVLTSGKGQDDRSAPAMKI